MNPAFMPSIELAYRKPYSIVQSIKPETTCALRPVSNYNLSMSASTEGGPAEGTILYVKAAPDGTIGDCPFSQKANLSLRFRKCRFDIKPIDLANKPQWFLDMNETGTTPVFLDGARAIADSDEIVDYADTIGGGPILTREDDQNWDDAFDAVAPMFGSLVRLLKNKDDTKTQSLKATLAGSLRSLNSFLKSVPGAFLLGDDVSALDCNLAPKLKHIAVAAKHYCEFDIPHDCDAVTDYLHMFEQLEEWKESTCRDDIIVWGWSKFFM